MSEDGIRIRPVRPEDRDGWAAMRRTLFGDFDPPEIDGFLATGRFDGFDRCAVFVAQTPGGALVGFAEASARPYAEGCETTPVGYLEGWFVEEGWRGRGVGAKLVRAVEDWARAQGLTEIASDADIANHASHKAHAALGFQEAERIVCFAKAL